MATTAVTRAPVDRTGADIMRQILVIVAVISTIIVNGLANALPINGMQTGDISDRFDVFFVPAGYVFSIWGLIYLGLIGYAIYQGLPRQATNPVLRAIGYPFIISSLANITWIFLWHYEQFPLTIIAMLTLLATLIVIYRTLAAMPGSSRVETWLVRIPFSIYLGWITVATIANVTSVLDYLGWNGGPISPALWAVIMVVVATVVGVGFSLLRHDIAYVAVLIWAFGGIAVKHSDTTIVMSAALIGAAILLLSLLTPLVRNTATPAELNQAV